MKKNIVKSLSFAAALFVLAVSVSSTTEARPVRGTQCKTVTVCDVSLLGYCIWSHEEQECTAK